jgi:hypothetical protein
MKKQTQKEEWRVTIWRVLITLWFPMGLMMISFQSKYWIIYYLVALFLLVIGERLK